MATTEQELQTTTTKTLLPPGPRGLPYIGSMLSFRQDPLGFFQQLQRTYGNMATVYIGKNPAVLLFRRDHGAIYAGTAQNVASWRSSRYVTCHAGVDTQGCEQVSL